MNRNEKNKHATVILLMIFFFSFGVIYVSAGMNCMQRGGHSGSSSGQQHGEGDSRHSGGHKEQGGGRQHGDGNVSEHQHNGGHSGGGQRHGGEGCQHSGGDEGQTVGMAMGTNQDIGTAADMSLNIMQGKITTIITSIKEIKNKPGTDEDTAESLAVHCRRLADKFSELAGELESLARTHERLADTGQ